MFAAIKEQRSSKRAKVNWQVEYTGFSSSQGLIHEGSKLVDYSQSGACFLTMSDIQVGMELTLHVNLPVRMARPLVFKGVVVRVDDCADVGKMFKEAAVRWKPNSRKSFAADRQDQKLAHAASSLSH
ncbi:MAG: hypothetical protein DMG06_10920 [Acidobacteria bacterium]|nr:MAG: hypothetical protein DMG06_10920 [Acidobacteriota bacterium]